MIQEGCRPKVLAAFFSGLYRSQAQIARVVGVSRERVRQILKAPELKVNSRGDPEGRICPECGGPKTRRARLCCRCWPGSCRGRWPLLTCETCGARFPRAPYEIRREKRRGRRHTFCSRRCRSAWVGKTYGFGRRIMPARR